MRLENDPEIFNYFHPKFLYEIVDDTKDMQSVLRQKALPFEFPLKWEDKNNILKFMMHFDSREKLKSLAAPQIGISKQMFVFSVPIGRGIIQTFPKSLWLNPSYENITDDMEEAYDFCLSVNMVAPVKRYKRIQYKAYNTKGNVIEGEAKGVAARVIQHEIDHLNGVLISDHSPENQFITFEEYKQKLKDKWGGKGWQDCLDVIKKEMDELREYYFPHTKTPTLTTSKMKKKKSSKKKKNQMEIKSPKGKKGKK